MLNLADLAQDAYKIAKARNQVKDGDPVVLGIKYLAGELVELAEAAVDLNLSQENFNHFESELADIIICACSISAQIGINLEEAVSKKMVLNLERSLKTGV